jgi:hypothetical protein
MKTNTHVNHLIFTRTIQNALQEADEHGHYERAAQFNAASDALAQLALPNEGANNG